MIIPKIDRLGRTLLGTLQFIQDYIVAKADSKHKPMLGCEIVVPTKQARNKLSTAELLAIGTSTASIATMIATIVNVLK